MQSLVVLALPLIGNAIAIPHPQAEPTRVAQLLTTDNSDCSEGSTHNLIDRECLNVATSYFVVSQSNGDVVNPNVGCLVIAYTEPECSGDAVVVQPDTCYPGFGTYLSVEAVC